MALPPSPRTPRTPLRGERAVVRRAVPDDVAMLAAWHDEPEVARYWDGERFTHAQMLERLARPDVDGYVIEADGQPVGYLQAWFGERPDVCGLDMFLIPSARGRGIGPDAARALARFLLAEAGRTRVTVDPYVWNESAVRGWRRAGFRPVEMREPDDGHEHPWLLLEFAEGAP